jgi:hypothetical protein
MVVPVVGGGVSLGKVMVAIGQLRKALLPMEVIPAGREVRARFVQSQNAPLPIDVCHRRKVSYFPSVIVTLRYPSA